MLQNTLHIQNLAFDAATHAVPLSESNTNSVALYEVAVAGKLAGIAIQGAQVGADSYLLVGDIVQAYNGVYKLLTREVKSGTTITVGTGGLFATLGAANAYINQRAYVDLVIDILSPLTETLTYLISNNCSGNLLLKGNGHLINFTGGARLEINGLNIHLSNFKVQASHATEPALYIQSDVEYDTALEAKNTLAGVGLYAEACNITPSYDSTSGSFAPPIILDVIVGSTGSIACFIVNGLFRCRNITSTGGTIQSADSSELRVMGITTGNVTTGTNSTSLFYGAITGNVTTGVNSNSVLGAITGNVTTGVNSKSAFTGNITGNVTTGYNSNSYFTGAITGNVTTNTNSTSYFTGAITGQVTTGTSSNCTFGDAITGNVTTGTNSNSFFSFGTSPLLGRVTIGREARAYIAAQKIESSVAGAVLSTGIQSIVELNDTPISCTVAGGTVTISTGSQFATSGALATIGDSIHPINVTIGTNSTAYLGKSITGNITTGVNSNVYSDGSLVGNLTTMNSSKFNGGASNVITGNVTIGTDSTLYNQGAITGNVTTGINSLVSVGHITGSLYFDKNTKAIMSNITVPAGGSVDFEEQVNLNLSNSTITLGAGVTHTPGKLNTVYHANWAGHSAAVKTAFNYTAGVMSSAATGSNLSNL